jgi:hypothetical protein
MGRPPIGKVAMTATERSHRYREKHGTSATHTAAATLARLEARVASIEAQLKPAKKKRGG